VASPSPSRPRTEATNVQVAKQLLNRYCSPHSYRHDTMFASAHFPFPLLDWSSHCCCCVYRASSHITIWNLSGTHGTRAQSVGSTPKALKIESDTDRVVLLILLLEDRGASRVPKLSSANKQINLLAVPVKAEPSGHCERQTLSALSGNACIFFESPF
jgi:hypothetical protein